MTNKELYQATFSQVHGKVRQADFPRRKRRSPRTFGLLAAAVLLVAALSATAVAEDWFGLRQAALPQGDAGSGVEENVELLSLQGWFGSPEHQAAADWQDFLNHYDDGGALDAIGNGDTGLSDRYLPYGVWTQEMAETLDTIAAKYGLALHQDSTIYDDTAAFLAVTGPFLDPALIYPGYATRTAPSSATAAGRRRTAWSGASSSAGRPRASLTRSTSTSGTPTPTASGSMRRRRGSPSSWRSGWTAATP